MPINIIGFEKNCNDPSVNIYLITMYRALARGAIELSCKSIDLGMTCGASKKKLGVDVQVNRALWSTTGLYEAGMITLL